jgi:hypothetical protein
MIARRTVTFAAAGLAVLLGSSMPLLAQQPRTTPVAAPSAPTQPPGAEGLWQRSEDGKPVLWLLMLDRGGGLYEGIVAKTFPKPGDPVNPVCKGCDDDRKNQPVLGISLIRDMKRNGLVYEGGNILDPRSGDIWKAKLTVSPDRQALTLRGYLMTPMLGKDETWQRLPDANLAQLDPEIIAKYLPAQAAAMAKQPGAPKAAPAQQKAKAAAPLSPPPGAPTATR